MAEYPADLGNVDPSAPYATPIQDALNHWIRRRRANFERDNAVPFNYYVDSVGGLDANDGLTPATAWQTMTKVASSATLTAGVRVGIKRGSVFRTTTFTVPGSGGSAASPVVIGSYGRGALPLFKNSTVLATWVSAGGGKYTKASAINPNLLYVDEDTLLIKAASAVAVTAGTFFSDGTTITLQLADSSDPAGHVIEYASGGVQFTVSVPYVDVQDLAFKHSTNNHLFCFNATAATSVGMRVKRCLFGPDYGGLIHGCARGLVEDCYFVDNWKGLEYPDSSAGTPTFTTNTDGTEVRYNIVVRSYKGIHGQNAHANLNIHHNIVLFSRVNGIDMIGGTVGKPPVIWNNFVWHRTATGTGHGIDSQAATVGPVWRNNIVYSDDPIGGANCELYCIDSTGYTSVDTDYNLGYIAPGSGAVSYGKLITTTYATLALFQTALNATTYAGKEAHSIQADPQLALMQWPGGQFVPGAGSPAVNAGTPVQFGSDGPGGIPDYMGSGVDMGAFERPA